MRRMVRTAVLAGVAATVLCLGGVLLTHVAGASSMLEALTTVEEVSRLLLTAGIPGGWSRVRCPTSARRC